MNEWNVVNNVARIGHFHLPHFWIKIWFDIPAVDIQFNLTLDKRLLSISSKAALRHAFSACGCVFKEITLVWANQRNFFENATACNNATACSKRTPKARYATQLKVWNLGGRGFESRWHQAFYNTYWKMANLSQFDSFTHAPNLVWFTLSSNQ